MLLAVDITEYQHAETVTIAAAPETVYDLVRDVTRMGEWSPVCTGGAWDEGGHQWFTGSNKDGDLAWDTKCRVDVADPGREFTFTNCGFAADLDLVKWSYTFAPAGDGCEVTERWEVLEAYPDFIEGLLGGTKADVYLDGVKPVTQARMAETLAKLKAAAEV